MWSIRVPANKESDHRAGTGQRRDRSFNGVRRMSLRGAAQSRCQSCTMSGGLGDGRGWLVPGRGKDAHTLQRVGTGNKIYRRGQTK